MRPWHWLALGGMAAAFVSVAGGGSLQPPPGPVAPTMASLDSIYEAVGGPMPTGEAYIRVGEIVGDVTTPGLVGFIKVKSWSGHEQPIITVEPGRAAPALLQKWRMRERPESIELRAFDAQGTPVLIVAYSYAKIDDVVLKGPPTTLDLKLNGRIDNGCAITWTHPGTNTSFSYNPTVPAN